jgi:hypothetical protein
LGEWEILVDKVDDDDRKPRSQERKSRKSKEQKKRALSLPPVYSLKKNDIIQHTSPGIVRNISIIEHWLNYFGIRREINRLKR